MKGMSVLCYRGANKYILLLFEYAHIAAFKELSLKLC